jgi:hypothetical protein
LLSVANRISYAVLSCPHIGSSMSHPFPCRKLSANGHCPSGCTVHITFCHRFFRGQRCKFGDNCRHRHFAPQSFRGDAGGSGPRPGDSAGRSRSPSSSHGHGADVTQALDIFGLTGVKQCSKALITAMYRQYAREQHPDKVAGSSSSIEIKHSAESKFQELKWAYDILLASEIN